MSFPPPLALVDCSVPRAAPSLHALPHVVHLLSSFLDPSPLYTPPMAAATGSLRLFERVMLPYDASGADQGVRSFWCAKALDMAIQKNDLAMVQKIHALHPEPLALRSLAAACKHGTLEMVQWIVEHRHDGLCCEAGVEIHCGTCVARALGQTGPRDTQRIVEWCYDRGLFNPGHQDSESVVSSTMGQSRELFDWYASRGLLQNHTAGRIICAAIYHGSYDPVPLLRSILRNASVLSSRSDATLPVLISLAMAPDQEDYVERLLASFPFQHLKNKVVFASVEDGGPKVLQWDIEFMKRAYIDHTDMAQWIANHASACAHIDTMRWLLSTGVVRRFRPPADLILSDDELLRLHTWLHANKAGDWGFPFIWSGNLALMQWYHANCPYSFTPQVMDYAAKNGHLDVVKWLHENREEGCSFEATQDAARAGHLEVVQWLFENRTEGDTNLAMAHAALGGHLDIVMWLCEHRIDACPACVVAFVLGSEHRIEDTPLLHTLQWLDTHDYRRDGCNGQCCVEVWARGGRTVIDMACRGGDLQLLTYLRTHHPECLRSVVYRDYEIVSHVGYVQWAFAHQNESYNWQNVRSNAAYRRYARTAEWLDGAIEQQREPKQRSVKSTRRSRSQRR